MENYEQPLSPEELQKLMAFLQQQQQNESGELSSDSHKFVVIGINGERNILKEAKSDVKIGDDYVPLTSREESIQVHSCGHTEIDPSKVQYCYKGHSICGKHELYNCVKCRRPICYQEYSETFIDYDPICRECKNSFRLKFILGLTVIGLLIWMMI